MRGCRFFPLHSRQAQSWNQNSGSKTPRACCLSVTLCFLQIYPNVTPESYRQINSPWLHSDSGVQVYFTVAVHLFTHSFICPQFKHYFCASAMCQARLGTRDPKTISAWDYIQWKQHFLFRTISGGRTQGLCVCHKFSGALFCTEPENLLIGEENQQQSEK